MSYADLALSVNNLAEKSIELKVAAQNVQVASESARDSSAAFAIDALSSVTEAQEVVIKAPLDAAAAAQAVLVSKVSVADLAALTATQQIGFIQAFLTAVGRTTFSKLAECVTVLDFMTAAERAGCLLGTLDVRAAIQRAIDSVPLYSTLVFPGGLSYLISGPTGLTITRSITLKFETGAWLLFNDNNATYVVTSSKDVVLDGIQINGGSSTWTRTGNAAIRVRDDGVSASTTGIRILNPRIKNVAGAGILVGWSGEIGDVTIEHPVVENTGADGVSITYNCRDVSVIAPRCYNTGDDGVSIVSYISAANPCRRITVTDALSVDSKARGLTVIGGQDIKISGQSINATAQGALILQDSGTYNSYPPLRISVDLRIYNSTGNGVEVGANAKNISGQLSVVGAKGSRGILIGSGAGLEPSRVSLDLTASDCVNAGIEINNATDINLGRINTANNGLAGLTVGAGTKRFSYGSCNAYNNNTKNTAGIDNILLSGVVGFSLGSTISIDDNAVPNIERTMDLSSCTDGIIGTFLGKKNTTLTAPNIQSTCVNVVTTGGIGAGQYGAVGTTGVAPTLTHYPPGTFLLDTVGSKVYFYTGAAWKSAPLT